MEGWVEEEKKEGIEENRKKEERNGGRKGARKGGKAGRRMFLTGRDINHLEILRKCITYKLPEVNIFYNSLNDVKDYIYISWHTKLSVF